MFKNFSRGRVAIERNVIALTPANVVPDPQRALVDEREDEDLLKWLDLKSRLHEALLERTRHYPGQAA